MQTIWLSQRAAVAAAAVRYGLPWIGERRDAAEAGALLAYGANRAAIYRRMAAFVDRVLRGANPGDLPIELPTLFDLIVNLRAARAFGLAIPPALLVRADEVIE